MTPFFSIITVTNNTEDKIDKTIRHTNSKLTITFRDYLIQRNVYDQLCDESWSMRGLTIKIINTP